MIASKKYLWWHQKGRVFLVIILYFRNTLNTYFLISQKLWVQLIKFMTKSIIFASGESTHLI